MATYGAGIYTLLDVAKMYDPNGKEYAVAEVLDQASPMIADAPMIEGTDSDGHIASVRTGLPSPTWRVFNQGVQPAKDSQATIKFTAGMLESVSNVDAALAAKYADPNGFRAAKLRTHLQGMSIEMQRAILAENEKTNPGRMTGLEPMYSSLSAENGENIIDCGGTGPDNTSIWIVAWHPEAVSLFHPKGTKAGITTKSFTDIVVQDSNGLTGATYVGHQDRVSVTFGLTLPDWRSVVRLCNIDHSNLVTNSSAADLIKLLSRGVDCLNALPGSNTVIYARKDVMGVINEQARASVSTGGGISFDTVDGKPVTFWRGIPIKRCDGLGKAEARIT